MARGAGKSVKKKRGPNISGMNTVERNMPEKALRRSSQMAAATKLTIMVDMVIKQEKEISRLLLLLARFSS